VERTCFDVLAELFARDIDMDLLRRFQEKTPTERIEWLEEMQAFGEEARAARAKAERKAQPDDAAQGTPSPTD
jgi:hypothetical protein